MGGYRLLVVLHAGQVQVFDRIARIAQDGGDTEDAERDKDPFIEEPSKED